MLVQGLLAASPSWWGPAFIDDRPGVSHAPSDNYAPANLGQLKNVAKKAAAHLESNLPGGAGVDIWIMVNGFKPNSTQTEAEKVQSRADNYAPINIGQLKAVAKPFYDRLRSAPINYDTRANLIAHGFQFPAGWPVDDPYPWNPNTAITDNYTPANIGQLKMVFSFDLTNFNPFDLDTDSDTDGLPDWWENQFFSGLGFSGGSVIPNSGGLTYQQVYQWYLEQSQTSVLGDGIPDSWKQSHGIDINDPDAINEDPDDDGLTNGDEYDAQLDPQNPDYDGDGVLDGQDLYPKIKNLSSPPNLQVVVSDWETESQSTNPDYSNVDYTKIELRWEASDNGPSGYLVERRINSDIWQTVATTSQLKYPDQNLLANLHYQYRITAYKDVTGQRVLSEPSLIDYEVPVLLSFDIKQSYISKWKAGYGEYVNPSSPPKYYLVQNTNSTWSNSSSTSTGGSSSGGEYSFSWVIDPAEHSKTQHGEYSYSSESNYSNGSSGSHSESSSSSTYDWFDQDRGKGRLVATTSGSMSSGSTSFSSSWTSSGSTSGSSSNDSSGSYLYERTYAPNDGPPIWAGYDFDLANGSITYSGDSSYSYHASSSNGSSTTITGSSTVNPDGSSTGTRTTNGSSYPFSGPVWDGIWDYNYSYGNLVSETQTERTYASSGSGYSSSGNYTLTDEYTTAAFLTDTIADMPDYPTEWTKNWYGWGNYGWGYWGNDGWSYWGNWYTWGYPWYGWWVGSRSLNKNENFFTIGKMKYRFKASPSTPYTMKWYEVFVPEDDPDTEEVDESKNIEIIRTRSWTLGSSANTSPEYEIADAVTRTQNGYYTIMIQPTHIGVAGIGEAGKDKTGDDTNPGKVVLINDHDKDSDGIPDYADGYNLSTQISEDDTCEDGAFTPIGIAFVATDPEHAKIRFTYDASDPKQVTSATGDPFHLPATGKMRLWKKDAWEQRDGLPVKSGGDFIKPGVDYTFADLGIGNYYSSLTCYVELVKLSSSVADIPIKVEVDPTGSMGYVWSDQLRFTGTKIELRAKSYGETSFATGALLQPSSLRDFDKNVSLFGRPPKNFNVFKISIWDPRTTLTQVNVGRSSINLTRVNGVWESNPLVGITYGSAGDYSGTELRIPIAAKQQDIEYNPSDLAEVGRAKEVPRLVTEVDSIVQGISIKMKSDGWVPPVGSNPDDTGIFGDAVHEKTSDAFRPRKAEGFITDLWLAEDGTVLQHSSYNTVPAGGNSQTVQIDLIKVKKGYVPTVGQKLNKSMVQYVFDVKTCDRIRLTETFETFLQRVKVLTGVEIVWAPQVYEKWSIVRKVWAINKRVARGVPWAKCLGAAGAASVLFSMHDAEAKFDQQMELAKEWRIADKTGTMGEVMAAKSNFYSGLQDLLNTVSIEPIQNVANVYGLTAMMLSDTNSIFEYDEEYDQN